MLFQNNTYFNELIYSASYGTYLQLDPRLTFFIGNLLRQWRLFA